MRGNLLSPPVRWVLLLIYLVYTLVPMIWLFLSTVQTEASLLTLPPRIIPSDVTLTNYVDIFKPAAFGENSGESTFLLALRNSVIVCIGTTLVAMVFGTMAAYAFARFNIPQKRTLLLIVLGSQLLPAVSLIIPLFRMFKTANLLDTVVTLILALSPSPLPFVVGNWAGFFQRGPP
jgi:multiple sugar transport system permease protein